MRTSCLVGALIVFFVVVLCGEVLADRYTWVGSVSDNWATMGNWTVSMGPEDDTYEIGSAKTTYWPVIHSNTDVMLSQMDPFTASANPILTLDGGSIWQGNTYFYVGRVSGGTVTLNVNSGSIDHTRWLRVGDGGTGLVDMTGGEINADAVLVGSGGQVTMSGGQMFVGGDDFFEASFEIAAGGQLDVGPDGYLRLDSTALQDGTRVKALGALNIVANSSSSGRLVIPWYIDSVAGLLDYFGDGSTDGNVNAIYNGVPGQFVFSYPGGLFTEITVIPEPTTLVLLVVGGLTLVRRKR